MFMLLHCKLRARDSEGVSSVIASEVTTWQRHRSAAKCKAGEGPFGALQPIHLSTSSHRTVLCLAGQQLSMHHP